MSSALLSSCLDAPALVVSVIGPHANEDVDAIFKRKMGDVRSIGRTFRLVTSSKVNPLAVQAMCQPSSIGYVVFIESSGVPRPTTTGTAASCYSADQRIWQPLPNGLGAVTGKLGPSAKAFILDALERCDGEPFDVWAYGELPDGTRPLDTRIGHSTVCVLKRSMSDHPKGMKSRFRSIVACARLQAPFCVWLQ
jgi:hypothetical protein